MMRILHIFATLVTILTFVASDIALSPNYLDHDIRPFHNTSNAYPYKNLETAGDPTPEPEEPAPQTPDTNTPYGKAWCKGGRLMTGMTLDNERAKTHIRPMPSLWAGDLVAEMRLWGWKDESNMNGLDAECDFDYVHDLGRAFKSLGINPESQGDGGPNTCYRAVHQNGPTVIRGPPPKNELPDLLDQRYKVGDKVYQPTSGEYTIGINPKDGVVYFINRVSPRAAAEALWEREPLPDELPALQASSDITWGFYNQAMKSRGRPLNSIKKVIRMTIIDPGTYSIIKEAISHLKTPEGKLPTIGPQPWPGTEFSTSSWEGQALLGTANGMAVGFFLAQHKAQLGLKYVSKITVFTDDEKPLKPPKPPNMLFWVEDVPPPKETKPGEDPKDTGPGSISGTLKSRVLKRSRDGRNVIREHIFYAKL